MSTVFTASESTLSDLWPYAKPHIERFSRETLLAGPDDIYRDVQNGSKQLWMVADSGQVIAVMVTEVYETLKGTVCCIWAACGNTGLEQLAPNFNEVEKWACDIGCSAIEIRGRKGWKRVLPEFKEVGILLEKDLRKVH